MISSQNMTHLLIDYSVEYIYIYIYINVLLQQFNTDTDHKLMTLDTFSTFQFNQNQLDLPNTYVYKDNKRLTN